MPKPGEFQPVIVNYKELEQNGITGPYYVQTIKSSVVVSRLIREFADKNRTVVQNFIDDWLKDVEHMNKNVKDYMESKLAARDMLLKTLPRVQGSGLYFCGSTLNNCGAGSSDADICWTVPVVIEDEDVIEYPMRDHGTFSTYEFLKEAESKILQYRETEIKNGLGEIKNVDFLDGARVKILKFKYLHFKTNTLSEIDLNINNVAGIYNTFLLRHYSKIDSRFPKLVKILKIWGVNANVINSKERRINSYTMTLMVVHYLQSGVYPPILPNLVAMCPKLFSGELELDEMRKHYDTKLDIEIEPENDSNLFELLLGFMYYYSHFDYKTKGILLREGRVIDKPEEYSHVEFFIEEVYDRLTVPKNLKNYMVENMRLTFLDSFMYLSSSEVDYKEWKRYKKYCFGNGSVYFNRFLKKTGEGFL